MPSSSFLLFLLHRSARFAAAEVGRERGEREAGKEERRIGSSLKEGRSWS